MSLIPKDAAIPLQTFTRPGSSSPSDATLTHSTPDAPATVAESPLADLAQRRRASTASTSSSTAASTLRPRIALPSQSQPSLHRLSGSSTPIDGHTPPGAFMPPGHGLGLNGGSATSSREDVNGPLDGHTPNGLPPTTLPAITGGAPIALTATDPSGPQPLPTLQPPPHARQGPGLATRLGTGFMDLARSIELPSSAAVRQTFASAGNRVLGAARFVINNEASSPAGRFAASAANITARNLISVGIPTELRQVITAALKGAMDEHLSPEAQAALSCTVVGIPMVLNLLGMYVDFHQETATPRSVIGRGMNFGLGASALALASATGAHTDTAAACVSTFIYCAIRDSLQACLRLPDESTGQHLGAVLATGVLYTPNQFAVNRGMTNYGSPSGASAAGRIGERWQRDVIRAGINTAGETVDDLVDMTLTALAQDKPLRVRLEAGLPSLQQVVDKILRMGSARPTVFLSTLMLTNLIDHCLVAIPEKDRGEIVSMMLEAMPAAKRCLVPLSYVPSAVASLGSDAIFAAFIGTLRIPQVLQGGGQADRPEPETDAAA